MPPDRCYRTELLPLAQGIGRAEDGPGPAHDPKGGVANELEKENTRLRRAVSGLTLDKLILQEAA